MIDMKNNTLPFFIPENPKVLFKCFDNKVSIAHLRIDSNYSGTSNKVPDKRLFDKAEKYLKLWPDLYLEFSDFVKYINPIESDLYPYNYFFSSSGTSKDEFGVIYTTARHSFTLAEALAHEMAHLKLFTLGIYFEHADSIITNNPGETYYSPVVDRERPMTAVFHAQYSFIHVLHLNNLILKNDFNNDDYEMFLNMTNDTLTKMMDGHDIIKNNIKTDVKGVSFVNHFMEWSFTTINQSKNILKTNGINR
jgi:hypothetical protein